MTEIFPNLEETFYDEVEVLVQNSNNSYMESIIFWCEQRNIEPEFVAPFILRNLALCAKLQMEAENLHFLKRTTRLPI
jgi:hypothetical protein